uniref:BACK domain-containing protein n=1 Tax=Bursaphelenchus xylophilus TaxID=6326 RepID=A0A1I7RRL4_BURXY
MAVDSSDSWWFNQLHPHLDDPSADICIHCLNNDYLFAHSDVIHEIWPQLLIKAEPVDPKSCDQKMSSEWKHIRRQHFMILLDKNTLNYLLELCYGRLEKEFIKNEYFYKQIEMAVNFCPLDDSKISVFHGQSFKDFHLNLLISQLKDQDMILKYIMLLKYDKPKAKELIPQLTYCLYNLIKSNGMALIQFTRIEIDEVLQLLSNDSLHINSEAKVLELILLFIAQNEKGEDDRLTMAKKLIPAVRFNENNFQEKAPELIAKKEMTLENLNQFLDPNKPTTRLPRDFLIIYGGWLDKPTRMCQVFARHQNKFLETNFLADRSPLAYHILVEMRQTIYLIGGYNNEEYLKKVRKLKDGASEWASCPSMFAPRCYASACTDDERWIYVCGGYNGRRRLRSVEKFDAIEEKWYKLPPMHHHRSDAAAAYFKGRVIVAGGFNGETVMPFVEIYCEETRQWSEVWNMNTPRSGLSIVPFEDKLYAIGGYTSGEITDTVEVLYDTHGAWREQTKLNQKRYGHPGVVSGPYFSDFRPAARPV